MQRKVELPSGGFRDQGPCNAVGNSLRPCLQWNSSLHTFVTSTPTAQTPARQTGKRNQNPIHYQTNNGFLTFLPTDNFRQNSKQCKTQTEASEEVLHVFTQNKKIVKGHTLGLAVKMLLSHIGVPWFDSYSGSQFYLAAMQTLRGSIERPKFLDLCSMDTWVEFLAPGASPSFCGHSGNEPVERSFLCVFLYCFCSNTLNK